MLDQESFPACSARLELWRNTGLRPVDIDVCQFYDAYTPQIPLAFQEYGFCGEGEGGAFVEDGNIAPGGRLPVTTDGGTMSFGHAGINAQQLQRVIRGVESPRPSADGSGSRGR